LFFKPFGAFLVFRNTIKGLKILERLVINEN